MKITKLNHACLLVEMPEPVNRTVLFDPGVYSEPFVDVDSLMWLDDIVITHGHADHMSLPLIKRLVSKFPDVRIVAPPDATAKLQAEGLTVLSDLPAGLVAFESPHESLSPLFETPDQIGVHYLDMLTVPGDTTLIQQSKTVLALPMQGPWGSAIAAARLADKLKPKHILPIHDWHWKDEVRTDLYEVFEEHFATQGITFHKLENGKPVVLDLAK